MNVSVPARLVKSSRVELFVDVSNLYYCIRNKYPGGRLDYNKLIKACKPNLKAAYAYGAYINQQANPFIRCLKDYGYQTKYKACKQWDNRDGTHFRKADWDVGITIDIVERLPYIDTVIIGSADSDFVPLVEYIKRQGKRCEIFACNISNDLKKVADSYREITEELLEHASTASA